MNIKLELLKSYISDFINNSLEDFEIDATEIADTLAINMLGEIQRIIKNERYSDFEAIEEIVCLFEKYKIDDGVRHDFQQGMWHLKKFDKFPKDVDKSTSFLYNRLVEKSTSLFLNRRNQYGRTF